MALQSNGPIKLSEIASEFNDSTPHRLSEFYGAASGIPASGQIKISDFYGASNIEPANDPSIMLVTHTSSSTTTPSRGTRRTYNSKIPGSWALPHRWFNYSVKEKYTNTLNFPYPTRYFSDFDGVDNYLWARVNQTNSETSTYPTSLCYFSPVHIPTQSETRAFFNSRYVFSYWVNPDTFTASDGDTDLMIFGGWNTEVSFTINAGKPKFRLRGYTNETGTNQFNWQEYKSVEAANSLSTGQWQHVAFCFYGDTSPGGDIIMEVHINNVLKGRTQFTNNNTTNSWADNFSYGPIAYIGAYAFGSTATFNPASTDNQNQFAFDGSLGLISFYGTCPNSLSQVINANACNQQVNAIWQGQRESFGR